MTEAPKAAAAVVTSPARVAWDPWLRMVEQMAATDPNQAAVELADALANSGMEHLAAAVLHGRTEETT